MAPPATKKQTEEPPERGVTDSPCDLGEPRSHSQLVGNIRDTFELMELQANGCARTSPARAPPRADTPDVFSCVNRYLSENRNIGFGFDA